MAHTNNITSLGVELRTKGSAETSWAELGIPYCESWADEVIRTIPEHLVGGDFVEGIRREAISMSRPCRTAAMEFARPVIGALFEGDDFEKAREKAYLFNVNYYETDAFKGGHRDFNNSDTMTAIVLTICGRRKLTAEGTKHDQARGSIVLIDGGVNPWHSVICEEGPSVSVVVDVPELLR